LRPPRWRGAGSCSPSSSRWSRPSRGTPGTGVPGCGRPRPKAGPGGGPTATPGTRARSCRACPCGPSGWSRSATTTWRGAGSVTPPSSSGGAPTATPAPAPMTSWRRRSASISPRSWRPAGPERPLRGGLPSSCLHGWLGRSLTDREGGRVRYESVAEAYRDLEAASARLELIDRLARLFRQTPTELLSTVALLCQGEIAPDFAGVELGLAERLAAGAVAQAAGVAVEQVLAGARDTGDLGLTAERLLEELSPGRPATLEVERVFQGLHRIAEAQGTGSQGRKLEGLVELLDEATPLEARYLLRTVTGALRLGIGTATILDAL